MVKLEINLKNGMGIVKLNGIEQEEVTGIELKVGVGEPTKAVIHYLVSEVTVETDAEIESVGGGRS